MIGRVLGDYSKLQQLPNVHFLGFKDYMELPQYGKHFDVSFMCWKMTDWIKHSNPLKTKEYLSIGLPVVSVRIDELEREYADLVYLVDDGPEFLDAVRKAILLDSKDKREARIDSVRGETWHERVELMMNLYKKAISNV
jgi:glycosyltransferase involved in cell wall biosynthesis